MGAQQKETVLLAFVERVEVRLIHVFVRSMIHSFIPQKLFECHGLRGREKVELLFKGYKVSVLQMKKKFWR